MKAVRENRAQFTPYTILTNLAEHCPEFPASSIGTHRAWAGAKRDKVIAYLRAYIRATEWLLDPAKRAEAINIAADIGHERESLPRSLGAFINHGIARDGTLSRGGFRQVGELLVQGGVNESLADMEKYADPSYQQAELNSIQ